MIRVLPPLLVLSGLAAGCSSPAPAVSCEPAPGSCDGPSPAMSQLDPASGCLGAPVTLNQICDTSVDQCFPSAGLGTVCAIAPDGGVFVAVLSDDEMLTAAGWRFAQPTFPRANAVPADEEATSDDALLCRQAMCAPPCPGQARPGQDDPSALGGPSCADAGAGDPAADAAPEAAGD